MDLRLRSAAASMTLLLCGATAALAPAGATEIVNRHCSEPKGFREVAQDEINTISELCMMRDGYVSPDRDLAPSERAPDKGEPVSTRDFAVIDSALPRPVQPPW